MPYLKIRDVNLHYRVFGSQGPWLALITGGRRGFNEFVSLAEKIAAHGVRVVLHDRRNTGASDILIEGKEGEEEIWTDDLYELLGRLEARPAVVGGGSSGARTSILTYLRHPDAVRALFLCGSPAASSPPDGCPRCTTASSSRPRAKAAWPPCAPPSSTGSASPPIPPTASA